ncbi:MAG: alanine--tRNA ligase-related protein [Patescibacteria group bacterium]|nr:alanine--tRNA ligase-related protein [Patescibacteria group bacterium]
MSYLIEMLDLFGFKRNKCYFVTPPEAIYLKALQHNQIPSSQTFVLEKNSVFWQEWDFGHNGLTGKGYTVVIAKDKIPYSISEMETDHEQFIELLNLIHVFGRKEDGKITPIANPGVELGVGVERLAAAINNCDCYNIDTIKPITIAISDYLNSGGYQPNKSIIRTITDHLLSIFILSNEGIEPSNKSSGYILRKMIRKLITDIWLLAYSDFNFARLVDILFSTTGSYTDQSSKKVRAIIEKEVVAMQTILQTAKKIAHQHSELSIDHIHQTYGISPSIMTIARRERQK